MFESKCNFADVIGIVFNNWTALKVSYRFCISLLFGQIGCKPTFIPKFLSKPALSTIPMVKIMWGL